MRLCVGVVVLSALGALAASAGADPSVLPVCNGPETLISGSYGNLTVTGNRGVSNTGALTVSGNLTIAPGACLDAFSMGSVSVKGNVTVEPGAIFALGCAIDAAGPPPGSPCTGTTNDVVGGNIVATDPWTMYLTADTVHGNVVSTGGGPGVTLHPYVNFPIKDMTIDGNLIVQNWEGAWFGALRNQVSGNLIVNNVTGATNGEFGGPDSNEVNTNTVSGNLICQANSPAIQFGDSGGAPNVVSGRGIGQCGFGIYLPDPNYGTGVPQPISVKG
jgi:hypothetical protein